MVHDLDLIAVNREDVLFTGVGVGVFARGYARLLSSGFLLMLKRCRDGSISAALRYVLNCDFKLFRRRDRCVSRDRGTDGEGRGRAISR